MEEIIDFTDDKQLFYLFKQLFNFCFMVFLFCFLLFWQNKQVIFNLIIKRVLGLKLVKFK